MAKIKTAKEALAAVQENGSALEDVPENLKTAEICLAAVQQDGLALNYVPEKLITAELCLASVQNDGIALNYVPEKLITAELCLVAVQQRCDALGYVPENLKTAELCLAAVQDVRNADVYIQIALEYVPEELKTAELCLAAVQSCGYALQFVPENLITTELCLAAVQQNGDALESVPEALKAKVEEALKNLPQQAAPPPITPSPSLASLSYYAAIDNTQAGPFDGNALAGLIKQGKFSPDTLVWKAGMAEWTPAGQVAELAAVFAPPPPPGAAPPPAAAAPVSKERKNVPAGFVKIEAGQFVMGSPEYEGDREKNGNDETPHQVSLDNFYMQSTAVTVGEFRKFVEATGYATIAERENKGKIFVNKKLTDTEGVNWKDPHFQKDQKQQDDHPVVVLTFEDCCMYCNWLSDSEGLDRVYTISKGTVTWNKKANGYRLPTEAEWEYACRAGSKVSFAFGGVINDKQAQFGGVEKCTVGVKSFEPSKYGLYNMHGNVFEWCWDFYAPYQAKEAINPSGPESGTERIIRGGSWANLPANLRSASRVKQVPSTRSYHIGFRMALNGSE